jgi:hypothetical protein
LTFAAFLAKNHKMPHKRRRTASNVESETPQSSIQSHLNQSTSITDEAQDLARQTSTQLSTPQNSSSSSQRANDRERLVNIVNSGYKFVIPITVSIYDYGQKKRPT